MSAISPTRPDIVAFMVLAATALGVPSLPPPKDIFNFSGDDAALADEKLRLAIQGKKSATTSWPVPDPLYWGPGDLSVILDGQGRPGAVMRTVSFVQCLFRDVEEEFALAEAEGDYKSYHDGHVWFYNEVQEARKPAGERGVFGDESLVLCERFEVIYPVWRDKEKADDN
ncbi:PUA-like domain-containing protein [Podospora appendiculata]|uniref:PUA-like domain-containing protein n=1 Tax=Podospora appendiculata TaxID=314037 RepID=A0AAE1CCV0_9PEZI|nr:PUA-like domain-containing protein [Podospora appendiculata]